MFELAEVLAANPNGVLAIRDGESLKTRVFQYLFTEEKRVYFCTSRDKEVYKQLVANPWVSFCTYPTNFSPVVSINGKTTFVDDFENKVRVLDENPMIKGIYKSPDNPSFAVFYVEVEEARSFSFADGAKTYKF